MGGGKEMANKRGVRINKKRNKNQNSYLDIALTVVSIIVGITNMVVNITIILTFLSKQCQEGKSLQGMDLFL